MVPSTEMKYVPDGNMSVHGIWIDIRAYEIWTDDRSSCNRHHDHNFKLNFAQFSSGVAQTHYSEG